MVDIHYAENMPREWHGLENKYALWSIWVQQKKINSLQRIFILVSFLSRVNET